MSKTIFTALFSDYEELKEPTVYTDDWQYLCFTDQPVTSNTWRIIPTNVEDLWREEYRIPKESWTAKHASRFIKINSPYLNTWDQSIWVDASFRIEIDLNEWWRTHAKGSFSAAKHPLRDDCDEEILACILSKRCDLGVLAAQRIAYKHIQKHAGVISSGILMRTPESVMLCEVWWKELCKWSTRDQVAFCNICTNFEVHMFNWDYRKEKDFVYLKHYKYR